MTEQAALNIMDLVEQIREDCQTVQSKLLDLKASQPSEDLEEVAPLSVTVSGQQDLWDQVLSQAEEMEVRGPDPLKPVANPLSLANRFAITESGKRRAANLLDYDAYVGPAPLSLEDYWEQVARQSIKLAQVTAVNLGRVFDGLVVYPDLLEQLGPAAVSGKPLFL